MTGKLNDFAVFDGQVQDSQGLGVFPGLADEGVIHLHRGLQPGVGMAADDHVNTRDLLSQRPVFRVADMGENHHEIGLTPQGV